MTSLVIGASGLVGQHLLEALQAQGEVAVGTCLAHPRPGLRPLDLRDAAAVRKCVEEAGAETIYLPASLTNVDYCETHPDESFAVNVQPLRHLVATGAYLVYFSSDYVFDGQAGPYHEADPIRPLSVYGRHKAEAEQAVGPEALIIRTTVVYGREAQGKNFIYRLRQTLAESRGLSTPVDQIGSPTYAPNLAQAAVALARKKARGIYHVVGPLRASRYDFALEAARVWGLDPALVQPVTTAELHQPAARPLNAGLLTAKAQAELPFDLLAYPAGLRCFHALDGPTARRD